MDTPPSSEVHPLSPSSPRPSTSLEEIRRGIHDLATSEKLDKESALQLTRLFHSMELLLHHECNSRDTTITKLKNDLDRAQMQSQLHYSEPPSSQKSKRRF